jgi:diguanylate cyclase (GGDEF)-like protein
LLASTLTGQADTGRPTAIVYVDLDQFKAVNDRLGHAAGDRLLEIAARRLDATVRVGDRVGRLGGDEFLVICPGVDDVSTALDIGDRLARALTASIRLGTEIVELRASLGVAWTDCALDPDTFVAQADGAMYRSKQAGRSKAMLYSAVG